MVLSPAGVLVKGLRYLRLDHKQQSEANKAQSFRKHYYGCYLLLLRIMRKKAAKVLQQSKMHEIYVMALAKL
jgi:hypothetical protein